MASDPLVTVIVATYNSRGTLALTLRSVLNQAWADFEVWIVGDACTDDSAEVVASFDDRRLNWINLSLNSGSGSTPNNEGLRRARGKYASYLGHDDLWFPWHLSAAVKHIEQTGADLVHSMCVQLAPWGVFDAIGPPRDGVHYDLHTNRSSTWLHRREVAAEIGGWRDLKSIARAVDADFMRRVHLSGQRIEFVPTLSVLKFGSAWWRAYAREGDPPQLAYLRSMVTDPIALRDQVLFDMAVAYTRYYRQLGKSTIRVTFCDAYQALRYAISSIGRTFVDWYGRERWPLARLLLHLNRQHQGRLRRERGLPPMKK
jgi:glycosyltransferase involved in cell wall biosynthesis